MDTAQPRVRPDRPKRLFQVALIVAFFSSIGLILFTWPLPWAAAVTLIVVAAASAAAYTAYFVPNDLSDRFKRSFTVGATAAGVIAALAAIPTIQDSWVSTKPAVTDTSKAPAPTRAPDTSATALTTPSPQPDPLTATLKFGIECELFTLPTSQLSALSDVPNFDAKWIYAHGGASARQMSLTVQGKSAHAVVLQRLRVVDLERTPAPSRMATVSRLCESGGDLSSRYFEISLGTPPRVVSRPGEDFSGKKQPAAKFPYKVSKSDPEYFEIEVSGPRCFCRWRLALDWISQGRSGTTIIDRGFGKIITATGIEESLPEYDYFDNKWDPPLPK